MNGKSYFLAASALCGLGTLTGCDLGLLPPSTRLVEKMAEIEADRLDKHDENITEQHKIQNPELAAKLDAQRTLFTQRMGELDKELAAAKAEQDNAWQDIIDNTKGVAATVAGLAGVPSTLTNAIMDKVLPKFEDVQDDADEAMKVATLAGAEAKEAAETVDDAMEDLDEIQKALARLSDETRDKFASATQKTLNDLTALRTKEAEFRRVLQERLQLTSAEMEDLKGMSTEQILAMLAAAGGAAGVGVAGGRGGKSRGQKAIDDAHRRIDKVKAELSRRPPEAPVLPPKPGG